MFRHQFLLLLGAVLILIAGCAGIFWLHRATPLGMSGQRVESWFVPRRLPPGAPAPDFTLERADGTGSVRLAELLGRRPIVLVFGSFT